MQEHLSVINVPKIFKKTTQGLTTKSNINIIKSIVHTYMQNPRSVILIVVPVNVDIATQKILKIAKEVNPNGHKILEVLTKPNLVDKGAEPAVIELIEGEKYKLSLGWHIVRNPGQLQILNTSTNRHFVKRIFFTRVAL